MGGRILRIFSCFVVAVTLILLILEDAAAANIKMEFGGARGEGNWKAEEQDNSMFSNKLLLEIEICREKSPNISVIIKIKERH